MRLSMLVAILMTLTSLTAQTTPLRVIASNGMRAVIEELRPRLEREVGRRLAIEFNTSAAVRQRLESGEAFDLTILTTEVVNELAKAGKIAPASVVDLGRSGIGFGIRPGAAKPPLGTPEDVKQTLLTAKSLTWVSVGASRVHIDRMLEGLGIAKDIQPKIALTQGVDESLARVADGKSEMILTLISEILPAKGVQLAGPLPQKFQNYVTFAGGVSPKSATPAAAALFIKILAEPAAVRVYERKGMELPRVAAGRRGLTK